MIAVWWLFWLLAQTVVFHGIGLQWERAFHESAITTITLGVVGFIVSNTFKYYRPVSQNNWLLTGYIIVLTIITGRILFVTFRTINENDLTYAAEYLRYMPLRGMFYLLMITLMTLYYHSRNKLKELGNIKQRENEAEKLLREAELSGLRQQLQPHFLFNSLNSISALAGSRPEEARKMIQQLSDFLRGTVRKDANQMVTLKEEFRHLELYLEIEKVRFGHRLQTKLHHEDGTEHLVIPSLLLQPIVENAVKFGLYDTTGEVIISISARSEAGHLLITVTNPFDASTSRPKSGTGFGLSSVRRRLYLLYARHDLLETKTSDQLFITQIKIPQTT